MRNWPAPSKNVTVPDPAQPGPAAGEFSNSLRETGRDMPFVMTQQEIDRLTYEVTPPSVAPSPKRDVCGRTEVSKLVSRELSRGRMFVVSHRSPAFAPSASLAFCAVCWPRWLMCRARIGFDLHSEHSLDAACGAGCTARKGGRRTQLLAQMSLCRVALTGSFSKKSIEDSRA